MNDFDVGIIGTGAVGLSLALSLAQSTSLKLRVFDAQKKPCPQRLEGRSMALSIASQAILAQMGVWEALATQATPIEHVHISMQGRFGAMRLHAQEVAHSALGYVVPMAHLESVLLAHLADHTHVQLDYDTRLKHYQVEASQVQLTFEQAAITREATCTLLLGCDGDKSTVREIGQVACDHFHYDHFALIGNVTLSQDHHFQAFERFIRQGALAFLPFGPKRGTYVLTVGALDKQRWMDLSEDAFVDKMQSLLGSRLGRWLAIDRRICVPLSMQVARSQVLPRVVLMGNAAHRLHPIAAQGLNLSLRDVTVLSECLTCAHVKQKDIGGRGVLESYWEKRRLDQKRIIGLTDKIARFMSSGPIPSALRGLGLAFADSCVPIRHWIARTGMGLQ